jgi:hypothetical protein
MGRGLSGMQRAVIEGIGEELEEMRRERERLGDVESLDGTAEGLEACRLDFQLRYGVYWQSGSHDASARAAWSRSLRRLAERGLVERKNWEQHFREEGQEKAWRTTHVQLTPAGWAEYRRLTGQDAPEPNG